ncbi:Hypothetical protein R9X50_00363700 [Acrodontium crateriforme]|uniref:Nuclease PA3 n=1 Tax=Acrodontium crateriforme TaxID=150365 RepID=A0AAQ3M2V8_9PEZI|nr:Hypothetical protein R9X50_00363700 [Acrodontium crateriforme]
MRSSIVLFGLAAVHGANAWGTLGHETVAYIAQNFVASSTASWAQNILGDTSDSYLANVATWADTFRYTTAGKWSAPFHFIDAEDNPPSSCSIDYDRDCGAGGCVVSAITNYTARVQSTKISSSEVATALKFIVHFVGDITQPLHDEAYEVGGNDVDVTFDGTSTNLHHIWDTNMPEELRGGYQLSDAKSWAADLTTMINTGSYKSQKAAWISGLDISNAKKTSLAWAADANAYVCSVVMPNGATTLESGDLYPTYYNNAIPTVELQIAKAGYRLAKWLDAIAAKSAKKRDVDLEDEDEDEVVATNGMSLLPLPRQLSDAQLRRAAIGYGCKH